MNILFVTHEMGLGGATLSLLGMIDQFRVNNRIVVLTRRKKGPIIEELKKRNVKIISMKSFSWLIPQNKKGVKGKFINILHRIACGLNLFQALRLKSKIKYLNIDLIHTNCSVVNIGALLSRITSVPHIWHIREFGQEDFGLSFVFSDNYSYRFMQKYSNKIICVSDALKEKYIHFIDKKKVIRIYNGIQFSEIEERNYEDKDKYHLLIAGRLSEAKGQLEAMDAIRKLRLEGKDNIMLHLAGSGDIEYYEKKAEEMGIKDQIRFYGHVFNLNELRKSMDVELVCSKKEAFGRVTIEAMSCGLPVIGADTGGTEELIETGETGLLYKQGDSYDLANKIIELLEDKLFRKKIALNGMAFARANFGVEKNAELVYKC